MTSLSEFLVVYAATLVIAWFLIRFSIKYEGRSAVLLDVFFLILPFYNILAGLILIITIYFEKHPIKKVNINKFFKL